MLPTPFVKIARAALVAPGLAMMLSCSTPPKAPVAVTSAGTGAPRPALVTATGAFGGVEQDSIMARPGATSAARAILTKGVGSIGADHRRAAACASRRTYFPSS